MTSSRNNRYSPVSQNDQEPDNEQSLEVPHLHGQNTSRKHYLIIACVCIAGIVYLTNLDKFSRKKPLSSEEIEVKYTDLENEPWPDVAWLASFPNSGTTYTLHLINTLSKRSTASNYDEGGTNNYDEYGNSVVIHPDYVNGPFRHHLGDHAPDKYILTKTHCGGRCDECGPSKYRTSVDDFRDECVRSKRVKHTEDGTKLTEKVYYDKEIVKKIVHLVRNPFDNIVSRFHCHSNHKIQRNDTKWLAKHPRNKSGFQLWCHGVNKKFQKDDKRVFSDYALNLIKDTPCHGEFFKFIQWHNHVFEITKQLGIPSFVLHYEDFNERYNRTVTNLFEFLDLEQDGQAIDYYYNSYTDYYTETQRDTAINWMWGLASNDTLKLLELYFSDQ